MATLTKFEELGCWKSARLLAKEIYRLTSEGSLERDYALRNQMRRAAVSIASNIAEGFERSGDKEFRQFLAIAKGSTAEVQAQLYIAIDAGFITEDEFNRNYSLAAEVRAMIGGLMKYLHESEFEGLKYKGVSATAAKTRD